MIVLGELDEAARRGLAVAMERVRAMEARLGLGRVPVVMMMATPEEHRAAQRERDRRRDFRKKHSLGRIVLDDIPHEVLIRLVLKLGLCPRPIGRALTFKEARVAFETAVREMFAGRPRVGTQMLISKLSGDVVDAMKGDGDSR